jgi:hypothetical protein
MASRVKESSEQRGLPRLGFINDSSAFLLSLPLQIFLVQFAVEKEGKNDNDSSTRPGTGGSP